MNTKKHALTQFELSKMTLRSLNKFELSPTGKLVLLSITDKYPNIYPSQKFIADELGISKRSVERAFNELRTKGIILTSKNEDTDTLNCKFTSMFFEAVKLSDTPRQKDGLTHRQNGEQRNNHEKTNKKDFSFYKNEGINYPAAKILKFERDEKTPLNDKETGLNYIKELLPLQNNPLIRKKIDEVIQIHDLAKELCPDLTSLSLERIKHTNKI